MAIQVSSIAELERVMMEQVMQGIQDTEDFLINETKDAVDKTVYQQYQPNKYQRTYTLRDSIQITNRHKNLNNCGVTVGHNDTANWFSIGDGITYDTPYIVSEGKYGTFVGWADDQFGNYILHNTTPKGSYSKPRRYMDEAVQSLKSGDKYLKYLVATMGSGVTIK